MRSIKHYHWEFTAKNVSWLMFACGTVFREWMLVDVHIEPEEGSRTVKLTWEDASKTQSVFAVYGAKPYRSLLSSVSMWRLLKLAWYRVFARAWTTEKQCEIVHHDRFGNILPGPACIQLPRITRG